MSDNDTALAVFLLPAMLIALLAERLKQHSADGKGDDVLAQAGEYLKANPPEKEHGAA